MTDTAFGVDETIVEHAAKAPALIIQSSLGSTDGVLRDTGLILTKEQIKNLKHYELAGLALPTNIMDVVSYLGYETGAGKGLEAVDFQKTFQTVHSHASLWNPLRTDLLAVGSRLQVFAGEIQIHGNTIEEIFADIKALNRLDEYNIKTLEDVRKLEKKLGSSFPGIELTPSDKIEVEDLGFFLDEIARRIKERETETLDIKNKLDAFGLQLATQVAPAIKLKIAAIDNNNLSAEIKQLQQIMDERAKAIEEKNKEYKEAVKQSISAVGPLPTLINLGLAIYIGIEAERIRKERNALRNQQNRDLAMMNTKDRILASLGRVRANMQDLDLIVIDADIATKNLITVWNSLADFVDTSCKNLLKINDGVSMRKLQSAIKLVIAPWIHIGDKTPLLMNVFKEADKEFREEYGDQK